MTIRGGDSRSSRVRRPLVDDELMMIAGLVLVLMTVVLIVVRG